MMLALQRFSNLSITFSRHASSYDVSVIGGGIIGVATALKLKEKYPQKKIALVEKESILAGHQSGNNSGVIHAGIYYQPGSLKATLCTTGVALMKEYCSRKNILVKECGKLIVAVNKEEAARLDGLFARGVENKVAGLKMVSGDEIQSIEPNCQGLKAIHSPHTAIVDYAQVTRALGEDLKKLGASIYFNFEVTQLSKSTRAIEIISKDQQSISSDYVVVCGGLYADRLAKLSGAKLDPKIVPFRGEYLKLRKGKENLVNGNIYPVPNPNFPFLGIHFTPTVRNEILLGPNALLAFSREGYTKSIVNLKDLCEILSTKGLWKLGIQNFQYGVSEWYRSCFMKAQVEAAQKLVPKLSVNDVEKGPAGVRAQAVWSESGKLVDDFIFDRVGNILHVRNAPSPAATSSLAIAAYITEKTNEMITN